MYNKENFISVLVDCNGYSREYAEEQAVEYMNDLEAWVRGGGGSDFDVQECREFLGIK